MSEAPAPPGWWLPALLVAVFAVYAPSLANGYTLDDTLIVRPTLPNGAPNGMTAELRAVGDYFAAGYWHGNAGEESLLYRPITVLSYAITNAVFDGAAWPHHLGNILLHLWATALTLWILRRFVRVPWHAFLGAAVFGLHAIHSEVVAGIVGRAELFGFCFGAQALLLVLAGETRGRAWRWPVAASLLWLAFCSKESALAWVGFVWVALTLHRPALALLRAAATTAIVSALPVGAFFALRHIAVGDVPADLPVHYLSNPLFHESAADRIFTATYIWAYGLFKCLWPTDLVADYGPVTFEILRSAIAPRFVGAAIFLVALATLGLACIRRAPLVCAGVACLLGFSVLVSNVPFAIGTIFGERLYYTPSLGIAFLVAHAAKTVPQARFVLAPVGLWLCVCIAVIVGRNAAWADDAALTRADAAANPLLLKVQDARAMQLSAAGDGAAAEALWKRILALDPQFVSAVSNYGSYLATNNRHAEAERLFLGSLQIPEYRRPLHHVTHHNLSVLYGLTGQADKSAAHLRLAWQQPSAFQVIHEPLLTRTHAQLPVDEAEAIVRRGMREAPDHPTWPLQRAYVALARNDTEKALAELRRAHTRRPTHTLTRWVLAATLLQSGDAAAARPLLRDLVNDPRTPDEIRDLATGALKG